MYKEMTLYISSCHHVISLLYLCNVCCWIQGNVQVFYRDLPLSIQEGYERFLSSETLTLHQYQVSLYSLLVTWMRNNSYRYTYLSIPKIIFIHKRWHQQHYLNHTRNRWRQAKDVWKCETAVHTFTPTFIILDIGLWTFEKAGVCCEQVWPQVIMCTFIL